MICPECAAPTVSGARFCHRCGRNLDTQAPGLRLGDRRVVSVLFADLVGYTRLLDELDPEEVRARVDGALNALSDAVVRFGGSLEKFVGDAVMAVFGATEAHDDDALRACLCALHMQAALGRVSETYDRPLQLRIGISTGEVVAAVRDMAGIRSVALTGESLSIAARLQALAEPSEVLLDEATVRAAEPRIGAESVGPRMLRGRSQPVAVFRLRDERRRPRGPVGLGRLIGRDSEKQRILDVIRRTVATGRGGAAFVRGEPGIGKSRLLMEMEQPARAEGFGWIWVDNAPHLNEVPYRGVRAMVDWLADERGVKAGVLGREMLFGVEMDAQTTRLVAGAVSDLARDSDMALLPEEGWSQDVSMLTDPAELARGLRVATRIWVSSLVARGPRAVVLDDLHWLDPSSRFLLDEMVRLAAELPLVVLAGARLPMTADWAELPHVEVIELAGLDEASTDELATMVGGAELEQESAHWLYRRSAGNPLFVGEIMRALRVGQRISRAGARLRIDRAAAQRSVPLSLRALLGARIDALPAGQRRVLEVAAVIGVEFPEWLLRELADCDDVVADLRRLGEEGIVVPCDGEASGEAPGRTSNDAGAVEVGARERSGGDSGSGCWRFRHELFHDAAYGRLLMDRRRELHTALADRLELAEPPVGAAELARHRIAAGDAARAIPLLERAAAEAEAVGAMAEAAAFRQAGDSLRTGSPPQHSAG